MPNAAEMEFLRGTVIPLFQNNANITVFSVIMPQAIQLETMSVNFIRANSIVFINKWPAKSCHLNRIAHLLDNLDQCVRLRSIPLSNVIQLRQALIQIYGTTFHKSKSIHLSVLCANDARQSFMLKVITPSINLVSDHFCILTTISQLLDKPSPTFGEGPPPHFNYYFTTFG